MFGRFKPIIMIRLLLLSLTLFALSCKNPERHSRNCGLKATDKTLIFPLDPNTKNFILALFPYTDKEGKEYLTFQNFSQNQILFYNMNTCQLEFKVKPAYEGAEGVGKMLGYHVHNLDSIFINRSYRTELFIIDRSAKIIDKIQFEKTTDSIPLHESHSTSATYHPIEIVNNHLYLVSGCDRWSAENPVTAYINLSDKTVQAFPNFRYPSYPGADNKAKRFGFEEYMSRCFDGEHFVYSFYFLENIQVASIDHQSIRDIPVKSKYIDKVQLLDDYGNLTANDICENPNYGNLLFDSYRKVYYRIAYPKTEVDHNIRGMELMEYGRKNFSIIILDEDFNIIGETLFPDYTYNSTLMFIREDGLYISDSHYLNLNFSDDVLSFQKFELIEME